MKNDYKKKYNKDLTENTSFSQQSKQILKLNMIYDSISSSESK